MASLEDVEPVVAVAADLRLGMTGRPRDPGGCLRLWPVCGPGGVAHGSGEVASVVVFLLSDKAGGRYRSDRRVGWRTHSWVTPEGRPSGADASVWDAAELNAW
jgi:hypothetical protein